MTRTRRSDRPRLPEDAPADVPVDVPVDVPADVPVDVPVDVKGACKRHRDYHGAYAFADNCGPLPQSLPMAQYIYTMNRVSKVVPPKRVILRDISLSFFPGAKIGVLGLNGSGKSTLLRIMAGADTDIEGEARPQPGIKVGLLPQEPQLDPAADVRAIVAESVQPVKHALAR